MSKKKITIISEFIFSALFVIAIKVLNYLNRTIWFDIATVTILIIIWLISLNYIFKRYKIAGYDDSNDLVVDFYPTNEVADHVLKYAAIMAKYNNQWMFVRYKERVTWEIPGGRRKQDEEIINTAERELIDETGASKFMLKPILVYSIKQKSVKSFGLLYYAEILELENASCMEICEIKSYDTLPSELTYPLIQSKLFSKTLDFLENNCAIKSFS